MAQTFTVQAGDAHTVKRVMLTLRERPIAPGYVDVSVRAVDGDGKPTGGDLCSDSILISQLADVTTRGRWERFGMGAGTALSAGTQYAIVVRAVDGTYPPPPLQGCYLMVMSTGSYTGGKLYYSTDSGVTWTGTASDALFEEWE